MTEMCNTSATIANSMISTQKDYNLSYILGIIQLSKFSWRKITIIFLSISLNICFGNPKKTSHWDDGSSEYPQHMLWWEMFSLYFIHLFGNLFIHSFCTPDSSLGQNLLVDLVDFFVQIRVGGRKK